MPLRLDNSDPSLAVAHGAAHSSWFHHKKLQRIESGSGHAIYLELKAAKKAEGDPLICILPHGIHIEEPVRTETVNLRLRVNQPVRFVPYYSVSRKTDKPGMIVDLNADDFHRLPALETVIQIPHGSPKPANDLLDVVLEARLNALGLLAVRCLRKNPLKKESEDPGWQLDFNLRLSEEDPTAANHRNDETDEAEIGVSKNRLEKAHGWISGFYGKGTRHTDPKAKVRRLISDVEKILGQNRKEWNPQLLRAFWEPLQDGLTRRNRSVDHEASWLNLAGYSLRPGYGIPLDEFRVNSLWRLHRIGLSFPKENRIRTQSWILWRRVAGGLDKAQQQALHKKWLGALRQNNDHPAELIRMAGSLERLENSIRSDYVAQFSKKIEESGRRQCEPYLWALGRLLSRVSLYSGPEAVLPPDRVENAFDVLQKLDWTQPNLSYLNTVFCQAARLTGHRDHDLLSDSMGKILHKMKASGARPEQIQKLEEVVPIEENDRAGLFGESLPPGLILKK